MGTNRVIIGTQWGDEGKGKIVDILTREADVIVRFQGGNNAGHTLVVGDRKVVLHLIPSGILHPDKKNLIGNGVVLDPEVFCREVDRLQESSVEAGPDRLQVSNKTHLIMPYHRRMDEARERHKKGEKLGTTGRGIGPAYEDKVARIGVRAADVLDEDTLLQKMRRSLEEKNALFRHLYGDDPMDPEEAFEQVRPWTKRLGQYLTDVSAQIAEAEGSGKNILFEGAQGTHLDVDHGTYPFVTSSNTVASNAAAGSGCGVSSLHSVIGVVKAYTTRVGSGPFPTELEDETGRHLQEQGAEFGSTTGRKRRCGWLDLPVLRESVRLNRPDALALTKLDVLGGLERIKLCSAYDSKGTTYRHPPQAENGLAAVVPVYETLPGWNEDISRVKSWLDLPGPAREYVQAIEEAVGVKVSIVSVGPEREQTLFR
jgi:adenylosuccinate synthase